MTTDQELADLYMVEEQGAAAKRNGEAPWGNPYVFGTLNRTLWERGWARENEKASA